MGIVSLRGRTPSPMASAVIARLHVLPPTADRAALNRRTDVPSPCGGGGDDDATMPLRHPADDRSVEPAAQPF